MFKVTNIVWDTDGDRIEDLPETVYIDDNDEIDEDEIADYLSDEYGWCIKSYDLDTDFDVKMVRFLEVKKTLNTPKTRLAYNRCFKKPWSFYKEHTISEAVMLITEEIECELAGNNKG